MQFLSILVISLLVGAVGAGFVWFGTQAFENCRAAAKLRKAEAEAAEAAEEAGGKVGEADAVQSE